ncbi:MAG: recombinase family protein [Clostridia bacterium]|uniref:recombinase family protein n=1 Tax=Oscillibacter sp. TaxID=1945593 RepID=UPI0021738B1A|nr:recombinase family protein [Oscillibacter sp.]MCI8547188.1 recombinase family protein [Clostridia bacterium]MCI9113000.1 recombinase family protein [Oscillibacter sp.]
MIDKVISYKLDRFTRSTVDFVNTMEVFDKYNVEFISATEGLNNRDKMGKAMLSIIVVFAQLERSNIIDRVRSTYYQRATQGFYLGGPAPFGFIKEKYSINGKKTSYLVADENVIGIVQEMFRKNAYDETVTLGKLKKWLASCNIVTGRGLPWTSASMSRILRNPVYVRADADIYTYLHDVKRATVNNDIKEFTGIYGCYTYAPGSGSDSETRKDKFAHMDRLNVTIAPHEGVIDSDTWLRCQYRLDSNRVFKGAGKGSYTWLSGIMKCGYCGYAMTVSNNMKKNTFYLSCGGRKRGICFERKEAIQTFELEKIVEMQLFERMKTILESEKALVPVEDSKKVNDLKIKMVEVQQRIDALTESIASLSVKVIAEVNKKIEQEIEKKDSLAAELEEALREQRSKNYSQYNIEEYINNWEDYDTEEKKRVARIFIDKVIVEDGDIQVIMK